MERLGGIDWAAWLAYVLLAALVGYVWQRYPRFMVPWGLLLAALAVAALTAWAFAERRRHRGQR